MNIWPEDYHASSRPNGLVREMVCLLSSLPFVENPFAAQTISDMGMHGVMDKDLRRWSLTKNGTFSVKSFYSLLNEGGLRCPIAKFFWRGPCLRKVNIFNWLAWKNKVLTLENLAK